MAFAWAELVPGTLSEVVSRSVSRDAEKAPTMVMATQIEITMTRRLMTKRIQRSNTLVAYKFVLALPGTVGVEQSHVLRARSLYRAVGSSTTFPLPHGSGTSCKSLDARKRHAPLGRRNWLGGIPKAVIPSPLAHAIGAGVWVATVASVALLANAATYFYLEYRLWNAWTPGVIAT